MKVSHLFDIFSYDTVKSTVFHFYRYSESRHYFDTSWFSDFSYVIYDGKYYAPETFCFHIIFSKVII